MIWLPIESLPTRGLLLELPKAPLPTRAQPATGCVFFEARSVEHPFAGLTVWKSNGSPFGFYTNPPSRSDRPGPLGGEAATRGEPMAVPDQTKSGTRRVCLVLRVPFCVVFKGNQQEILLGALCFPERWPKGSYCQGISVGSCFRCCGLAAVVGSNIVRKWYWAYLSTCLHYFVGEVTCKPSDLAHDSDFR